MIFPSEYSRRHHARLLGLEGSVIPDPIPLDRIIVDNPEPQYVTFVNPQLPKGVAVFARIAIELNRKRPDIPLLIGAVPELDPVFDLENRKPGLTPRSPSRNFNVLDYLSSYFEALARPQGPVPAAGKVTSHRDW